MSEKPLLALVIFLAACLPVSTFAQDSQATLPDIQVSAELEEALKIIPAEPDNLMCSMDNVKKFRRSIVRAREEGLVLLESKRVERCRTIKSFDDETEKLFIEEAIGKAAYDRRKRQYSEAFQLHCDQKRAIAKPPEGLFDLYHFISGRISALEVETSTLVDDCKQDGQCSAGSCEVS